MISFLKKVSNKIRSEVTTFVQKKRTQTTLAKNINIRGKEHLTISKTAIINHNVVIQASAAGKVSIDDRAIIGIGSVLMGGSGIQIGKNVLIAPNCVLAAGNHNYKQTDVPMLDCSNYLSKGPIIIEDDVWIGANCVITDGVTIGKGSVIGAGTVVCNDIPPNKVVYTQRELKITDR